MLALEELESKIVALSAFTSCVMTTQCLFHFPSSYSLIISSPILFVLFIKITCAWFALKKIEFCEENSTIRPASLLVKVLPAGDTVPLIFDVMVICPFEEYSKSSFVSSSLTSMGFEKILKFLPVYTHSYL